MSNAWKDLERKIVKVAEECGLKARRLGRGADFGVSTFDVELLDLPNLRIDAKYRKNGWAHHTYVKEIQKKYCKNEWETPILVTKGGGEQGEMATLPLRHLFELLADNEELDGTCDSHPAWWRGNDEGCRHTVEVLNNILDGKDKGVGTFAYEGLEKLRRRLLELV